MELNAEGFVDKVLFFFQPKHLNEILEDLKKGRDKASNLFNRSVKYGLSLQISKRCIEHCLNQTSKLLGKPIEQIIEEYEFKNLKDLLSQKDLNALKFEMIKFTKLILVNYSDEFRDPDNLNCEKIARLEIAMMNMRPNLFDVFSSEVISQASKFFFYIIDENKIDEINFICNMIDNLSLDNNTDDDTTKFAKLVLFLNDFMFRKNNIIKFINKSFDKSIKYFDFRPYAARHNVNEKALVDYKKFLIDTLQSILEHSIDLNSEKKINELLDSVKLNTLKEKVITFIHTYGKNFYDFEIIAEKCNYFNSAKNSSEYFLNNFFDIETPIYPISDKQIEQINRQTEQTEQINILINYFNWLSRNNQSQNFPNEIKNIPPFLNIILNVNYNKHAINSILNFNSTKNLLSKIGKPVTITINEIYNFLSDFNKNFPNIMYPTNPIPKQENSIKKQNSK